MLLWKSAVTKISHSMAINIPEPKLNGEFELQTAWIVHSNTHIVHVHVLQREHVYLLTALGWEVNWDMIFCDPQTTCLAADTSVLSSR